MDCGVCLDNKDKDDFTVLPCNHTVCNECFPKIRIPVCPFCRHKYGNTNNKYYDEILNEEFEIDLDIFYFSDDMEVYQSPRTRRRRQRRQTNPRPRPRQTTSIVPVNIFVLEQENEPEQSEPIRNKKIKKPKRNQQRRNHINNSWNYRNLQSNISQSY